jgi:hypothetical protein
MTEDTIHLQRRFVRRIECGTTGRVRVTEKLSEATGADCRTANAERQHLNACEQDDCATCDRIEAAEVAAQ